MSTCPLCRERKGKRACPASGALICAQCCGAKRRVEIECPDDCTYLTGAHAGGWEGRETERRRDMRRLAPAVQGLSEPQAQLFFLSLAGLVAIRGRRRELDDRLLLDAVQALRKTVETRVGGLLYEHPPADARAIALVAELQGLFEVKEEEDAAAHTPSDADLRAVLVALETSLGAMRTEAAGAHAFLDTAVRLTGRFGSGPAAERATAPLILVE